MIISILNQKGGVAKTTTAIHVAHGLALRGIKTLLIDLDPQANCSDGLGIDPGPDVYNLLIDEQPLADVTRQARQNLDLLRSDRTTVAARQTLAGRDFREHALANALEGHHYDAVVIDNAPSLDVLQTAALVASDYIIIPTLMAQFSVKGIYDAEKSIKGIRRATASTCQIVGIIPTMYDRRENTEQLRVLVEDYGRTVWPVIPVDAKVKTCNRHGQTLFEYAPSSPALIGYRDGAGRVGGYQVTIQKIMELL